MAQRKKPQYSKIIKVKNHHFRYNYEKGWLEWVELMGGKYKMLDARSLCVGNFKESPNYWCNLFLDDINAECAYELELELGLNKKEAGTL